MPSKHKQIIDALSALLQTVDVDTFEFNPDSAIEANGRTTVLVMRDDDPAQKIYEPLGGDGAVGYSQSIPVEIFVFHETLATREETMDTILLAIDQALRSDPYLGGLIEGRTYGRPEMATYQTDNKIPHKRADFSIEIEYYSASPLS